MCIINSCIILWRTFFLTLYAIFLTNCVFLSYADYAKLSVNSSVTNKCPGDVITVLCSTENNEIKWVWQSNALTYNNKYSVDPFSNSQLNVPHTFSTIQSVSTTLLNYSIQPLYLKSSLQYVVSSEYPEANKECNDYMYSPSVTIQVSNKSEWLSYWKVGRMRKEYCFSRLFSRFSRCQFASKLFQFIPLFEWVKWSGL